jgi:hypothetical protein
MTARTLNSKPQAVSATATLRSAISIIARALDTYAAYRLKKAVPTSELRRAERTIRLYSRPATRPVPAR